jgi:hypothetical protein
MSETVEREIDASTVDVGSLVAINQAEVNQQITTAKRFPRSVKGFRNEALELVTLTEAVAAECIYALPRDGKVIEGPSARFAEVLASSWGNCRAGARVVAESDQFVTAQGFFWDLEKNCAIGYEVQRRITDKNGNKFKSDMVGVTANAACSIALRNAILKGIPKALWADIYGAARKTVAGDVTTLANKRANAIKAFQVYGVSDADIFALLGVKGVEDIGIDELVALSGVLTAIKEGDTTPEQAFAQARERAAQTITGPRRKSSGAQDKPPVANGDAVLAGGGPASYDVTYAAPKAKAFVIDSDGAHEATEATADPQRAEPGSPPSAGPDADFLPATESQKAKVREALALKNIDEEEVVERFGCTVNTLPIGLVSTVLNWAKGRAARA